jgi:hypothetical protein
MMRAKTKNDPSRYVTRASLAAARPAKAKIADQLEQERRDSAAQVDERWYIQLAPRRRQR